MKKESELVEVKETYNKEGYLVKLEANGLPLFIPKQDFPSVKFLMEDVEWIVEKKLMTKEEFKQIYNL